MKTRLQLLLSGSVLLLLLALVAGCNEDSDPGPKLTGTSKTFSLAGVSSPSMNGSITFAERDDEKVLVTLQVDNTTAGDMHPAHIHANSAAEGGSIVLDLESVDGATGKSETVVDALNDGTAVTYEDLLAIDGYVNVHLSSENFSTLVAQGDIGQNELTGDKEVYNVTPVAYPDVTGTATFAKRANGETLITVMLENTVDGESYASHIHSNTIAEGGGIVINLSNVDGTTGMARTNVTQMNDGTPITYEELLAFNGYLNVHGGGSFVGQVDIGQNALTGDKKEYTLSEQSASGVSGTATFAKRKNGKTQITLALTGTTDGGDHPAHIHANDAATGGGIVLDLENVVGATGKSVTSANMLKDGTAITYDELINYNGHINVHLSPTELGTRIAQGNIGSNAL